MTEWRWQTDFGYAIISHMKAYRKRICDALLADELASAGAVLIEGAKWCGKTTTAEQAAKSAIYIDEPGKFEEYDLLAHARPGRILDGESPRLIDEWQLTPALWDAIRYRVDHGDGPGQYILTGSSVPPETDEIRHSGAGRFSWIRMRPMSLWESCESSGEVSLGKLFAGEDPTGASAKGNDIENVAFMLCRGGWPLACELSGKAALRRAFAYLDAVVKSDISRADGVRRDEARTRRLMRSYARLQGTQSTLSVIREDLSENEPAAFGEETISSYLGALRKIFVVEDMPAWCPNLRSKAVIRTADTRYFTDPSIAAAALGVGPDDLLNDMRTYGLLFETMAVRDLRVYADALDGIVSHYHDANGLECDAVVHLRNGRFGLVEVKMGGKALIEKGAATLNRLADKIDPAKMKAPAFKMVLTAVGDYAYRRKEDGVVVCPISALRD